MGAVPFQNLERARRHAEESVADPAEQRAYRFEAPAVRGSDAGGDLDGFAGIAVG